MDSSEVGGVREMRFLVLGGYGAVGARIAELLRAGGHVALAAGRDPARADRVLDLRQVRPGGDDAYREAAAAADVVVNASGAEDPHLALAATAVGTAYVDITADTRYVAAVEALRPAAPVLLSVGLAPGLSGILATEAAAAAPGPVDLAVVLGAGERHGAAATDWSYRLLGQRFADTGGGRPVLNYSAPQRFEVPLLGQRRLYRTDFADQHTLTRRLGVPVRTFFGLDSRTATGALAVLTRVPGSDRLPRGGHLPGTDRWWVLARAADGAVRWAHGRTQSHATALVAARAATAAAGLPPGVHHLPDVLTAADLPAELAVRGR
ncbi:hypothetical protein ACGFX4_30970 [Kitasatospora sp. NPDC048365]|uniref:hypothetical protein n=1 Tax=Kitasatospora sp. NPDC048365 TaxID=3364050 RepID=UPI003715E8FB